MARKIAKKPTVLLVTNPTNRKHAFAIVSSGATMEDGFLEKMRRHVATVRGQELWLDVPWDGDRVVIPHQVGTDRHKLATVVMAKIAAGETDGQIHVLS